MLLSTLVQSWNWLGVKYIYIWNPELNGFKVVFLRSFMAMIVLVVIINKNLKNVLYDSFPSENKKHMFYRILFGIFSIMTMNSLVKYFPLSTIAVIINLNPIFTMFLGYFILKEKVTKLDVLCLIISFIAVLMMIFGMNKDDDE